MKLSKPAFMAAKNAIYNLPPDECLVLVNSHSMPDEVISAWRTGNAVAFMQGLQQVALDRAWAEFCRDNEIKGWTKEQT
jgi:hypothetical protein